jgi:alpha,alpha-trehalase
MSDPKLADHREAQPDREEAILQLGEIGSEGGRGSFGCGQGDDEERDGDGERGVTEELDALQPGDVVRDPNRGKQCRVRGRKRILGVSAVQAARRRRTESEMSDHHRVVGAPVPPAGGAFAPVTPKIAPFPPIAAYGFLSDRESVALVAPSGAVEWMCLPRPDSPSVFAAILDRAAGSFRVGPPERQVPASRRYVPGTNVLETTWQTDAGWLVVQDALLVGPWLQAERRDQRYVRPPTNHRAQHVLLRLVECVNGRADVELDCQPSFDGGRRDAAWSFAGEGYGRAVTSGAPGDPELRLTTDLPLGFEGRAAVAFKTLQEGEHAFVALSWEGTRLVPEDGDAALQHMERTLDYWRDWLDRGSFPDHPWTTYLQRSALTLKALTYAPTGALMAAATTSLPEVIGGERNWDYRFSWVRDATFALWSLYTLGFAGEAKAFFNFLRDRAGGGHPLQIMYGIGGEIELDETVLDHLSGYEDSRPVRVGNAAYAQDQHDVWGALLDSVYLHHKAGEFVSHDVWEYLSAQVEAAVEHWKTPDRGIWEMRGDPRHFTLSKIMCWVACDRGAVLASEMNHPDEAKRWRDVAEEIRADVLEHGVDERGVLTQSYGSSALDASLLLAPLFRFLPSDDPRIRATVLAIADELTVDGMVRRYRPDDVDDGLSGEEATFTTCSFWLVSALVEIGETDRAQGLLERLLGSSSSLGLYAEEIDPTTGRHLGNFPQAFTHLALVNAVLHVIRARAAEARHDPVREPEQSPESPQ